MLKQLKKGNPASPTVRSKTINKVEVEATYERRWLLNPDEFNPLLTAIGRNRIDRTWEIIQRYFPLNDLYCVDLGAGYGILSIKCQQAGAHVTAVDISERALHHIRKDPKILCEKQFIPYTTLPDMQYQLVIAADLIASLPEEEYRLFFSELARLATRDGHIIVSTPLDIDSEDPLDRFFRLAETEITIDTVKKSYHSLTIRLLRFLKRWKWSHFLFHYPIRLLETSDLCLKILESITYFLYDEAGISHIIIGGKRRPLFEPLLISELPQESKRKKTVWE